MTSVLSFFWPRRTRRHYWFEKKSSRHNKVPGTSAAEKLNGPAAFRWRRWIPAFAGMTAFALSRE